jgi:hypothetical protein
VAPGGNETKRKIHITARKPQKGFKKKRGKKMNERGVDGLKDLNNKNMC